MFSWSCCQIRLFHLILNLTREGKLTNVKRAEKTMLKGVRRAAAGERKQWAIAIVSLSHKSVEPNANKWLSTREREREPHAHRPLFSIWLTNTRKVNSPCDNLPVTALLLMLNDVRRAPPLQTVQEAEVVVRGETYVFCWTRDIRKWQYYFGVHGFYCIDTDTHRAISIVKDTAHRLKWTCCLTHVFMYSLHKMSQ